MSRTTVRIILIFLLASMAVPLHSQIALGVSAGVNRVEFTGDPPKGFGVFVPRPGFSSNLRFDYRFNDAVGISIQPGYSILRSKYVILDDSKKEVVDSTYFTMNSLSLPLHAVVWSENGRFYVTSGFEFTYTLDFTGETLISPVAAGENTYEVSDYNIYAQFGAGFIIPLGKPYLSFEIRYSQGLNDLTESLVHQDSFLPRTKLTNTHFLMGIHLPLGDSGIYTLRKHR